MDAVITFDESEAIPEATSPIYTVTLQDADGNDVNPAAIDEIYLTLRDVASNQIVNSRNAVAVKSTNGGTTTTGLFTMQFDPEDMPSLGKAVRQKRRMTLDIRLTSGGRLTREVLFSVKAMQDIT